MTAHPFEPKPHHALIAPVSPAAPVTAVAPPQIVDGFAPPPESLANLDDRLADGIVPADSRLAGLAGEPSPF